MFIDTCVRTNILLLLLLLLLLLRIYRDSSYCLSWQTLAETGRRDYM